MKEWIGYIVLIIVCLIFVFVVNKDGIKQAKEETEKSIVYCLASEGYCEVGIFRLYTTAKGNAIIEIKPKSYPIAGAGADVKQGGK